MTLSEMFFCVLLYIFAWWLVTLPVHWADYRDAKLSETWQWLQRKLNG